MIRVEVSREVQGRAEDVFAFLADHANNPNWQGGMQTCTWTSPPPIGIGSTYDQVARFLGREIRTSFEVVEFEAGRTTTIESRSGPLDLRITRAVEEAGPGRTRVNATVEGTPTGFLRLVERLMAPKVRRDIERDYDALVELLGDQHSA